MKVMEELKNSSGVKQEFDKQNVEAGAQPMLQPNYQFSN